MQIFEWKISYQWINEKVNGLKKYVSITESCTKFYLFDSIYNKCFNLFWFGLILENSFNEVIYYQFLIC
jgi:hypothetical protein